MMGSTRATRLLVLLVVCVAGALRLTALWAYPDAVHHDHMLNGAAARALTLGNFFHRPYGAAGPVLVWTTLSLWLFDAAVWALRVPAAICGTLVVAAVYLIGRDLLSARIGLIAAALAACQHVLLLFSRLPDVMEPVAPTLFAVWCAIRAWQRQSVSWAMASGFLAGYALWGYWGGLFGVILYVSGLGVAAVWAPAECWRRRRLAVAALLVFVVSSPLPWGLDSSFRMQIAGRLDTAGSYDAAHWSLQWRRGVTAIYGGRDAGTWGSWTNRSVLLWPDLLCLALAALTVRRRAPQTPVIAALLCAGILFIVFASVLPPDPGDFIHLLAFVPVVVLLEAIGIDALRFRPLMAIVVIAIAAMHLNLLWRTVSRVSANGTTVAAVWMADHRAVVPCIALLRRPEDPPFATAGLYALVRDVPVRDDGGASVCPAAIVLPGATAPPWAGGRGQWRSIPSVDGPVTIWQGVGG
jgi:4-amino-4-deoxy-L-arabinose transferase-like glycosyltransferase